MTACQKQNPKRRGYFEPKWPQTQHKIRNIAMTNRDNWFGLLRAPTQIMTCQASLAKPKLPTRFVPLSRFSLRVRSCLSATIMAESARARDSASAMRRLSRILANNNIFHTWNQHWHFNLLFMLILPSNRDFYWMTHSWNAACRRLNTRQLTSAKESGRPNARFPWTLRQLFGPK